MANNNHFLLTLDTTAPAGGISASGLPYWKQNGTLTLNDSGASFMKLWFNTTAVGTKSDTGYTSGSWIPSASSAQSAFSTDGVYYYHLVMMDDVGNESSVSNVGPIYFDTTAPQVGTVEIRLRGGTSSELITTRDVEVYFTFSDNLSGCVTATISGDINVASTNWDSTLTATEISQGYAVRNIVLSGSGEEETTKTVAITVYDNSGNSSSGQDNVQLDTMPLTGTIILKDTTETTTITNQWVNVQPFAIVLSASEKQDWKGYKVWGDFNTDGGSAGTTEPATYTDLTAEEKTAKRVVLQRKLTSGDSAAKTVNAKLIDDAGNETTLTSVITKYDATPPTVSFTATFPVSGSNYVSLVSGFNTVTLTPTVSSTISGSATYNWQMNGSDYTGSGHSGSGDPVALTVNASDLGTGGESVLKRFTLTVVDNAGNSTTSSAVDIYLDTVAPAGTATMSAWYNSDTGEGPYTHYSTAGVTASATDGGSGMKYMTCWCSQTDDDTSVPVSATQIAYAQNPTHGQVDWSGHGESSTNYIHIKYVDVVGNVSFVHSNAFGIDTVLPGNGSVAFTQAVYDSTSATVNLGYTDATSGVAYFKIWGDITEAATEALASWQSIVSQKSVTLTTPDAKNKTVSVKYKDVAGNVSAQAVSAVTELDTTAPSAAIVLRTADDSGPKPSFTPIETLSVRISGGDDLFVGQDPADVKYQLYGDYTFSSQSSSGTPYEPSDETKWHQIIYETGEDYMYINDMYCTSGDGLKTIYVAIRDNAGHITTAHAAFTYDTEPPIVDVSGVDYNRISEVHEYRQEVSSGTVVQLSDYCDTMHFVFEPDSLIIEYKVCAYGSQSAAEQGDHTDTAIPMTNGSIHMSGSGIETDQPISCTLMGEDLAIASANDGVKVIVVYVKDKAGQWSAAAEFEA